MEIEVTRAALEAIRAAAERALPEEACGLLFGRDRLVERAIPARNVDPAPQRRFEIDPQALIDAHRAARQGGPEVVGYYHSHPAGTAKPSAADREMAAGDGSIWAIAAAGDVTFWRDDEDGFVALSYIADDG